MPDDLPFVATTEVIDEETGEVIEVVAGDAETPDLARVAAAALEAAEQAKLWTAVAARQKGILAAYQIDKRAVYDDALVTLSSRSHLDRDRLRHVLEDAGLTDDEAWTMLLAATGFEKGLPQRLAALVLHATEPGKPFAIVTRARRMAPQEEE